MADEKKNLEDKGSDLAPDEKTASKDSSTDQAKAWSLDEMNENSDQNLKNASDRLDQIEQAMNSDSGKKND